MIFYQDSLDMNKVKRYLQYAKTRAPTMPLGVVVKPVSGIDPTHTNFYSKNVEYDNLGVITMTRMIVKMLVGIHFASIGANVSAKYWAGRWLGVKIQLQMLHDQLGNTPNHEVVTMLRNLIKYAEVVSTTKKTKASKKG